MKPSLVILALAMALAFVLASCGTPTAARTDAHQPGQSTLVAAQVATNIAGTTSAPTATADLTPSLQATQAAIAAQKVSGENAPHPVTLSCAEKLEKAELREPYRRDKYTMAPRFTYASEEWNAILSEMGLASICVPRELGAPYLVSDWDAAKKNAMSGRMVTIGFQASANDAPEARGWLVYATYNLQAGTEYDRFSRPEDWDAVKRGVQPGMFEANGNRGFARAMASAYSMGTTTIYQTYVIPFETGYVALAYNLGAYEGDLNQLVDQFNRGAVPANYKSAVELYAAMARTIQVK